MWSNSDLTKVKSPRAKIQKRFWHKNPCENIHQISNPVTAIPKFLRKKTFLEEISSDIEKTGYGIRQNKKMVILSHYLPAKQRLLNSALFHSCSSPTLRKKKHTQNSPTLIVFDVFIWRCFDEKRKEILQKWIHMWNICLFDYLNDKRGLRADQMEVRNSIQVNYENFSIFHGGRRHQSMWR